MEREKEIWANVSGWEGTYQISNHGRLKSFKKNPCGYILSYKNKSGWYFTANLRSKGKETETTRIHILVAKHFIPNPMNKPEVNHKDGNKQNNYFENLEWVTRKENNRHAIKNGLASLEGMHRYNQIEKPRAVVQFDKNFNQINKFPNCKDAGSATGICPRNIHQVAAQTTYRQGLIRSQAGGFVWRFDDEL